VATRNRTGAGRILGAAAAALGASLGLGLALLAAVGGMSGSAALSSACGQAQTVGATEYGGPGDPSSGTVGAAGVSLLSQPDSFAELGGTSFATATALGGLPYGTPLEITAGRRTVVAYKEDIGLGGGPIDGHPRVIDLWWQLARALGIPYEDGRWSGTVEVAPAYGDCQAGATAAPVTSGPSAQLLADGAAAAPASAPAAVQGIIAAGNQIAGRPYLYGGAHDLPLNVIAPYYDCSSSVSHLLFGGGLLPAGGDMTSGELESWGDPGPGRWVTIYANPTHVFMYVAGLRWDTWNAAGPGDGASGIGWHPLVRSDAGFVVRHPPGL
jgi:cell wall-associated NlpC family hydrolase